MQCHDASMHVISRRGTSEQEPARTWSYLGTSPEIPTCTSIQASKQPTCICQPCLCYPNAICLGTQQGTNDSIANTTTADLKTGDRLGYQAGGLGPNEHERSFEGRVNAPHFRTDTAVQRGTLCDCLARLVFRIPSSVCATHPIARL